MAHYDIHREQLAIKYPGFGHALWLPEPRNRDRPVQVGDVGFIREGKFQRLFNALLSADDQSHEFGVPEYHEPLVPSVLNHIDRGSRSPNNYCSAEVIVGADPDYHPLGPDDFRQVSFQHLHSRTTRGAVLSLPAKTLYENTLVNREFGRWMVQHIGSWLAFARKLGVEEMEDIVLADAQVSFGVKVEGSNINYQLLPELVRGAVIGQGPEGTNLPENQCVFVRGFRVARAFWPLPKHLKAAAGPNTDPGGHDCDPDMELVSIPATPKYRDPLHLLQDYIAEQASDCDVVLTHDSDLLAINGIGHGTSLETLEPDVMMDLLRKSNIEIHKVSCDLPPSNGSGGPNTDVAGVKVAMVSVTFQNWNTASPSQWSTLASENTDLDHTNESRGTPPTVPGNLKVPTVVRKALGESPPTYGGRYLQVPVSPQRFSRMPVGVYDAVIDTSQALRQPPAVRSTLSELHLVRSANETSSPDYSRARQFRPSPDYYGTWLNLSRPLPNFRRPTFPEPYDASNTYPTFGSYPQAPVWHQRIPVGYGMADEPQPGRRAFRNFHHFFYPSQDLAIFMGGSYSHQSANETQFRNPLDFIHPQSPRPMTAAWSPSRHPAGIQNALEAYPQVTGQTTVTKKRRALIIGTNYSQHPKPRFKQRHFSEDAVRMADFLCDEFGFKLAEIRLMTDNIPWDPPTKDNILGAMRTLVDGAQPGDSLFFYFSGHSRQNKNTNGDALDGLDECICAMDYRDSDPYPTGDTPGLIVDGVMHEILVKPLPRDCRLTAMFDSCHSGTALDLPHIYDSNGNVKPITHTDKLWLLRQEESRAHVVSLSASRDDQTALEIDLCGALRRAFIECVRVSGDTVPYRTLLQSIRGYMIAQGFKQRPLLSTSYEMIDPNIPFIT